MEVNLRSLIESVAKRHPGQIEIVEFSKEERKRAESIWKEGMRKIQPLIEEARQANMQALARAKDFIVGSSSSLDPILFSL